MATRIVHISSQSMETVFEGTLQKAPPLNWRGRKKWKERFFLLRANRTFEFYKSKKAAESHKSPRRIVDLRECINLEVGLGYKNYQYVMCIATFKRIFFFAAPSDLVMYQWSTYLAKVKNAQDGDSIEVLDIGLRRKAGTNLVRNVRPSIVSRAFSGNRARANLSKQRSKSAIALMHFKGGSTETMDLRGGPSSQVSPILSPVTPTSDCSFKSEDGSPGSEANFHERFPSLSSEYSSSSHSSSIIKSGSMSFSPAHGRSTSNRASADQPIITRVRSATSVSRSAILPMTVPPPKEIALRKAARNKDGFFMNVSTSDNQDSQTGSELSSTEDEQVASNGHEEFTAKEGRLKRLPAVKKSSPKSNERRWGLQNSIDMTVVPQDLPGSKFSYNNNMTRSFRYKKINLRAPEKPLYADSNISESEDECDSESDCKSPSFSCVPGPLAGGQHTSTPNDSTDSIIDDESFDGNLTEEGSQLDFGTRSEDGSYFLASSSSSSSSSSPSHHKILSRLKFLRRQPSGHSSANNKIVDQQPHGRHSLANTYSRVTMLGTKEVESSGPSQDFAIPERTGRPRMRSNSQPVIALLRRKASLMEDTEAEEREENGNPWTEAAKKRLNITDLLSSSMTLDTGLLSPVDLPARPSSEVFAEFSQNSMDDLVIPPPPTFCAGEDQESGDFSSGTTFQLDSPSSKPKLTRTQDVTKTILLSEDASGSKSNNGDSVDQKPVPSVANNSVPDVEQKRSLNFIPESGINRNSTDSNDTGYTSTSPGYQNTITPQQQNQKTSVQNQETQHQNKLLQQQKKQLLPHHYEPVTDYRENFNAGISPEGRSTPIAQEDQRVVAAAAGVGLKSYSSTHSLSSNCSDVSRLYVPLVFHSKKVPGAVAHDPHMFCVQVCLVENSEELIRDLISLKSLEAFSQVEAEEVEGDGNVVTSEVDDFTVETSLEDLEFGFSVTNSTQKDIFSRKVRQFTYEIQNLFGSQKPFSCDVEINYGNQQTVLSIEVM